MHPHDDDELLLNAVRGASMNVDTATLDTATLDAATLDPELSDELRAASRLGDIARAARSRGLTTDFSDEVDVASIAASVRAGLATSDDHGGSAQRTPGSAPSSSSGSGRPDHLAAVLAANDSASPTNVVPLRRTRRWVPAAAAAVVAVVSLGIVATIANRGPDETVLALTSLDAIGPAGGATAELVEVDGELTVHVHTPGLTSPDVTAGDGYFEVWLLDATASELLSLGPAVADGVYSLPEGFDPATLPVVDVSVEHFDGDPTHSGDSVLRGVLDI